MVILVNQIRRLYMRVSFITSVTWKTKIHYKNIPLLKKSKSGDK